MVAERQVVFSFKTSFNEVKTTTTTTTTVPKLEFLLIDHTVNTANVMWFSQHTPQRQPLYGVKISMSRFTAAIQFVSEA